SVGSHTFPQIGRGLVVFRPDPRCVRRSLLRVGPRSSGLPCRYGESLRAIERIVLVPPERRRPPRERSRAGRVRSGGPARDYRLPPGRKWTPLRRKTRSPCFPTPPTTRSTPSRSTVMAPAFNRYWAVRGCGRHTGARWPDALAPTTLPWTPHLGGKASGRGSSRGVAQISGRRTRAVATGSRCGTDGRTSTRDGIRDPGGARRAGGRPPTKETPPGSGGAQEPERSGRENPTRPDPDSSRCRAAGSLPSSRHPSTADHGSTPPRARVAR